jgi:DNA gyrase/topoisomerase IV subunit B
MSKRDNSSPHKSGTQVSFIYDSTVFSKDASFDMDTVCKRLRELAFLNSSATIHFSSLKDGEKVEETFQYKGGIAEYVRLLTEQDEKLHECIHFTRESDACDVRPMASRLFFCLPLNHQLLHSKLGGGSCLCECNSG